MEIKEFEEKYVNKIIHGNSLEIMRKFPDGCIDFCMTSPPYWSLRSYPGAEMIWDGNPECEHDFSIDSKCGDIRFRGKNSIIGNERNPEVWEGNGKSSFCQKCRAFKGELGLEPHPQIYVNHLVQIFREIKRILKNTGNLYVNLGDTYFGAKGKSSFEGEEHLKLRIENKSTLERLQHNLQFDRPSNLCEIDGGWLQPKQLLMIPSRVAIAMQKDGWILRNSICWFKKNSMPSSVRDRLNNTWEYIFHFVKSNKKQYWVNSKTMQLITKQPPTPSTGIEEVDWDWKICPNCRGTGKVVEDIESLTGDGDEYVEQEKGEKCKRCKGEGRIKVSNWRGWDYFYDLDAIRKPHQTPLTIRPFGKKSDNKYINYRLPKTSNEIGNPAEKNPGDCFNPYQDGEFGHYHQGKDYHPMGKNPSDVVRNRNTDIDWIKGRGGNESGIHSLSGATYHYKHDGKNPGDIIAQKGIYKNKFSDIPQAQAKRLTDRLAYARVVLGKDHDTALNHPLGKTPGDFFEINTQPFPDAHFAVFPDAIVINPLKSSCPKEVCIKCGMPKVRIMMKGDMVFDRHTKLSNIKVVDETGKSAWSGKGQRAERMIPGAFYKQKEIGYAKCSCNVSFNAGICLDPFAGSGTTLLVAKKLGYRYIGIEIVKNYVLMAKKRLKINDYYVPNSLDDFLEEKCQKKSIQ